MCWVGDEVRAVDFAQWNGDVSSWTVGRSDRRRTEMSDGSDMGVPWPPVWTLLYLTLSWTSSQWNFLWRSWLSPRSNLPVSLVSRHWALFVACQWEPWDHWQAQDCSSRFWWWRRHERVLLLIRRPATVVSAEVDGVRKSSVPRLSTFEMCWSRLKPDSMLTPSRHTKSRVAVVVAVAHFLGATLYIVDTVIDVKHPTILLIL